MVQLHPETYLRFGGGIGRRDNSPSEIICSESEAFTSQAYAHSRFLVSSSDTNLRRVLVQLQSRPPMVWPRSSHGRASHFF